MHTILKESELRTKKIPGATDRSKFQVFFVECTRSNNSAQCGSGRWRLFSPIVPLACCVCLRPGVPQATELNAAWELFESVYLRKGVLMTKTQGFITPTSCQLIGLVTLAICIRACWIIRVIHEPISIHCYRIFQRLPRGILQASGARSLPKPGAVQTPQQGQITRFL